MNKSLSYNDIVLEHNQSVLKSRKDADITITDKNGVKLESPVILTNMPSVQNAAVLEAFNKRKWPYIYHRLGRKGDIFDFVQKINEEDWHLKSISVGVQEQDYYTLQVIKNEGKKLDWICIDVALIWNKHYEEYIKSVRKLWPNVYLIAGNFTNPECLEWLFYLGVDCAKFGIGVSNVCRTRQYTGFGTATISDLIELCDKRDDFLMNSDYIMNMIKRIPNKTIDIICDGGLTIIDEEKGRVAYGDIFKALNFGAKWVQSSSLFRWVSELADSDGNIEVYGNSHFRAKGHCNNVEGTVKKYKTNGESIYERMDIISDHLRSSVSYAGLEKIEDAYNSCEYKIIN